MTTEPAPRIVATMTAMSPDGYTNLIANGPEVRGSQQLYMWSDGLVTWMAERPA